MHFGSLDLQGSQNVTDLRRERCRLLKTSPIATLCQLKTCRLQGQPSEPEDQGKENTRALSDDLEEASHG